MRAKISFITLAVDDFGRSVAFYRDGLGWQTEGIVGQEFHDEVTGAAPAQAGLAPTASATPSTSRAWLRQP